MKKIYIIIALAAVITIGCNSNLETEGISRITYFPDFIVEGEDINVIDVDEAFTEPEVTVLEQGSEIPFTAVYTGRYTGYEGTTIGSELDEYTLTYEAVNRDGFEASRSITIARINTGNFVNSIEGAYLATSVRVNDEAYENLMVLVVEVAPNVFEVTDALGGFYSDGRALGDGYLVEGLEISINDLSAGDFSYEADVQRVDEIPMTVSEMEIDADTKTISFRLTTGEFADGDWNITLTQIQP